MTDPLGVSRCWAGKRAFFGGRWLGITCNAVARNLVRVPNTPPDWRVELCDVHFNEVLAAGLITEPYAGPWLRHEPES